MIFKLRIILEAEENVFRDVEVKTDQTLLDLHHGIKAAFDLKGEEMSSFYLSNDDWYQGSEISLEDVSEKEQIDTMAEIKIEQVIPEKGNKMIFVYDFLSMWTFYVEVMETDVISANSDFPALVFSYGERPEIAPESEMFGELDIEDDFDDEDDFLDFDENYGYPDNL